MIGLVYMPSFHTVAAILLMYGFRGSKLLIVTVVNCGMIAATPFFGNHYLADIIVGAMIAGLAILLVRGVGRMRYFSQI